jgi:hypothetical protein
MSATKKRELTKYTAEQVTRGLMMMVVWNGNQTEARKSLIAEDGLDVPASTLKSWCTTSHRDQYEQLRAQYAPELEEQLVKAYRTVASRAVAVQMKAVEEAEKRLDRGADTDPARTAASLAKVSQTSTDKLMSLTGRPAVITEDRSMNEILRSLAAKIPGLVVFDGEAEES